MVVDIWLRHWTLAANVGRGYSAHDWRSYLNNPLILPPHFPFRFVSWLSLQTLLFFFRQIVSSWLYLLLYILDYCFFAVFYPSTVFHSSSHVRKHFLSFFSLLWVFCGLTALVHLEMLSPSMLTTSIELHSIMQGSRKVDSHVDSRLPKRSTLEYSHFFYFLIIIHF